MKLVVMIPALNEEKTIGKVIDEIPRKIPSIDTLEILVINDGSTDKTESIAREKGAHVVNHSHRLGLARSFRDGLEIALSMGADIIVNTDADNQYDQTQIPSLVAPIAEQRADFVLGSRFLGNIEYMPPFNYWGNRIATHALSIVAHHPVSDGQTGFRAFSRDTALRLIVQSRYTYTQETILQAAHWGLHIVEVPVDFRKRADQSRLISNVWSYARRSFLILLMGYLNYRPLKVFLGLAALFFSGAVLSGGKVLLHFLDTGQVTPFLPSALLASVLLILSFQLVVIGLLTEMIKNNRRILEESLYRARKEQLRPHA